MAERTLAEYLTEQSVPDAELVAERIWQSCRDAFRRFEALTNLPIDYSYSFNQGSRVVLIQFTISRAQASDPAELVAEPKITWFGKEQSN